MLMALAVLSAAAAAPVEARQGRATVECKVVAAGRLTDCVLLSESPPGAGVGAFALKLVTAYRIPPHDRRIRNGRVTIPLKFKMP